MTQNSYYKHHIFFCLNQRENGQDCCANHGAHEAFDHCKAQVKAAGLAGVGTLVTSMRETLLIETWMKSNSRDEPMRAELAMVAPSVITLVMAPPKPRIETAVGISSS
mgnify:CR=1 FL=1